MLQSSTFENKYFYINNLDFILKLKTTVVKTRYFCNKKQLQLYLTFISTKFFFKLLIGEVYLHFLN